MRIDGCRRLVIQSPLVCIVEEFAIFWLRLLKLWYNVSRSGLREMSDLFASSGIKCNPYCSR